MIKKMVLFGLALAALLVANVAAAAPAIVLQSPVRIVHVAPAPVVVVPVQPVVVERHDMVYTHVHARYRPVLGGTVTRERTVVVPRYTVAGPQKAVVLPPAPVLAPIPSVR